MPRVRPRHLAIGLFASISVVLACAVVGCIRLANLPPIRSAAPTETTLHVDGKPVRIIALQTGSVTIKGAHYEGSLPDATPYPLRFIGILADPRLGARMPIWSYVLVHPEGVFVVDAGAVPTYNDDASWAKDPVSGRLVRSFLRLDVNESEALPGRLDALGIALTNVRAIVLTHQHVDHTGAVPSFPQADIWTTQAEDHAAQFIGAVPWRWRDGKTRVRHVDIEGEKQADIPWPSIKLTTDGRIEAFHSAGHTPGSTMVRFRADEGEVWFVGDISFRATGVFPDAPTAGIHTDMHQVRVLHAWLSARPARRVFLPSHDDAVPATLAETGQWGSRGQSDGVLKR